LDEDILELGNIRAMGPRLEGGIRKGSLGGRGWLAGSLVQCLLEVGLNTGVIYACKGLTKSLLQGGYGLGGEWPVVALCTPYGRGVEVAELDEDVLKLGNSRASSTRGERGCWHRGPTATPTRPAAEPTRFAAKPAARCSTTE